MKLLSYSEFVNESIQIPSKEINQGEFPNPITSAIARIFTKKGKLDGDKFDDIVKTKLVPISAIDLKPSQDAVYLSKALGMAIGGVEGGDLGAIISRDNYILDGHHRWAATIFNNPKAKIKGYKADLDIEDLIPVLRALGDVFGNERRGEPKGGDINIFKATIDDVMDCIMEGKNMSPKFYNREKSIEWMESKGGRSALEKSLKIIQSTPPPSWAPPRSEMPVIDAEKGEEKVASNLLNKGEIDVKAPYAKF